MGIKRSIKKFLYMRSKAVVQALGANSAYKNTKIGKRCFILGNGPSLKTEDLSTLAGEDVFTVNQAARHPDFPLLKSVVHFWADPNFFVVDEKRPEDLELIEVMKRINTPDNRPLCFFPLNKKDFVEHFGLDKELRVGYFHARKRLQDSLEREIDFTTTIPALNTVVMYGIAFAIFMGYSEIYLLGVDSTSLMVNIKSFLKINDSNDYCYNIGENEKIRLQRMVQRQTLEAQTLSFYFVLLQYRILNNYCCQRGIKLINCSSTTLIESIPRMSLREVLSSRRVEE